MKTNLRVALAVIVSVALFSASHAATVYWEGKDLEVGGTLDNNWDLVTANWRLNAENGPATTYTNGDTVIFKDDSSGLDDNGTVVITAGGVSPASVTFNRGFGKVYTISGGDILTGSLSGIRDDTKTFTRSGSYSFPGGTFATAGGSHFNYNPPVGGTYNFGTGTITVQNGSFNFNPGAAATLTNNFVLSGGGSITGNANATFTGNLTISGNNVNVPQNSTYVFPSLTLSQNTTINADRCCSVAPAVQFNSNVNGAGIHSLILASGNGNADWTSRMGAPSISWDVLNITKTNRGRLQLDANDHDDFFSGIKANGGKFFHRAGTLEFRTAAEVSLSTFNLDFPFIFNPDPAFTGPGPLQTGPGFFGLTTLNVNSGGVLGGVGKVARASGLGGFNPTIDANVNVVVNSGGQIAPGLSVGILTIQGNVTMNSGSEFMFEVNGGGAVAGTDYDRLNVTGSIITLSNADLIVDFGPGLTFSDIQGDVLTLITSANNLTGSQFDSITYIDAPFFFATVTYGNGFVTLSNFIAVPEPSTFVLLGLGAVGMALHRRRRGRRNVRR